MKTLGFISDLDELNNFIDLHSSKDNECILRVYDNKSSVLLQTVVVKHPVIFIRGIQEYCKSVSLPVSDISVQLVGFITVDSDFISLDGGFEISPFVYFKKPEEVDSKDVDSSESN